MAGGPRAPMRVASSRSNTGPCGMSPESCRDRRNQSRVTHKDDAVAYDKSTQYVPESLPSVRDGARDLNLAVRLCGSWRRVDLHLCLCRGMLRRRRLCVPGRRRRTLAVPGERYEELDLLIELPCDVDDGVGNRGLALELDRIASVRLVNGHEERRAQERGELGRLWPGGVVEREGRREDLVQCASQGELGGGRRVLGELRERFGSLTRQQWRVRGRRGGESAGSAGGGGKQDEEDRQVVRRLRVGEERRDALMQARCAISAVGSHRSMRCSGGGARASQQYKVVLWIRPIPYWSHLDTRAHARAGCYSRSIRSKRSTTPKPRQPGAAIEGPRASAFASAANPPRPTRPCSIRSAEDARPRERA